MTAAMRIVRVASLWIALRDLPLRPAADGVRHLSAALAAERA